MQRTSPEGEASAMDLATGRDKRHVSSSSGLTLHPRACSAPLPLALACNASSHQSSAGPPRRPLCQIRRLQPSSARTYVLAISCSSLLSGTIGFYRHPLAWSSPPPCPPLAWRSGRQLYLR